MWEKYSPARPEPLGRPDKKPLCPNAINSRQIPSSRTSQPSRKYARQHIGTQGIGGLPAGCLQLVRKELGRQTADRQL
eukprot:1414840-Rhodomonas_salina.2